MPKTVNPVYRCDAAGCRSYTELTALEDEIYETALKKRGWEVVKDGDKEKYLCPGCRAFGKVPQ